MIEKIVVPLDGSTEAEGVLPWVRLIASRTGSEVLLLTSVQQIAVWDPALAITVMDREEGLALEYLERVAGDLSSSGFKAQSTVTRGPAAERILDLAEREGASLIAITTHGRSGISRWFFGSVSGKLIQSAPVPLLVIRSSEEAKASPPPPVVDKILVPLDGSAVAASILPFVEEMARTLQSSLVLVHAIAPLTAYPGFEMMQPAAIGQVLEEAQQEAGRMLARVANDLKGRGIEASALVTIDLAVDGIVRTAQESGADMIAIATHGRGGLGRAVLGSVADGVVRHSRLPCLLVNAREPAS